MLYEYLRVSRCVTYNDKWDRLARRVRRAMIEGVEEGRVECEWEDIIG